LRTTQQHIVAVIPARYDSSRLPGKVLADIAGKPMVEHVYRRASEAPGVDAVVVATDDERIASAVETFGGVARLTQPGHRTGTDRVAEMARDLRCEIVINVQADLPLIEPEMIAEVIAPFTSDAAVQMSTLRQTISDMTDHDNPNVVKVVVNRHGDALYFSRSKIPHCRENGVCFKHIGLYGFRREFLLTFAALQQTPLERAESLEQLRALEHGYRIRAVETRFESIEVDTPDDLERVRRRMSAAARV
jgi:3-deoxy-manno-octulosonate cytidylyltransferase (CMP-KDO synthetase)